VLEGPIAAWLGVGLAQAALGYIQYLSGVPVVLVGFHIAGATALWSITVWMREVMWAVDDPEPVAQTEPAVEAALS
jgi:heme A synthase